LQKIGKKISGAGGGRADDFQVFENVRVTNPAPAYPIGRMMNRVGILERESPDELGRTGRGRTLGAAVIPRPRSTSSTAAISGIIFERYEPRSSGIAAGSRSYGANHGTPTAARRIDQSGGFAQELAGIDPVVG